MKAAVDSKKEAGATSSFRWDMVVMLVAAPPWAVEMLSKMRLG